MVKSLFNPTTKEWNHNELQQLFDKDSIEGIIRITIPASPTPDKLIWVKDPKGKFTVKSAYHASQLPTSNGTIENIWQDLWKLKIHNRTKMLLWRIGSSALPTEKMLAQRIGGQDTLCHLCGAAEESDIHLFFECSIAKAIWFGCNWSLRSDRVHIDTSEEIVKRVLDPLPRRALYGMGNKELVEQCSYKMALTLEAIWNLRNLVAHKNEKVNILTTINCLELKVQEHLAANCGGEDLRPQGNFKWSCPPSRVIKLNVDAAVLKELVVALRNGFFSYGKSNSLP